MTQKNIAKLERITALIEAAQAQPEMAAVADELRAAKDAMIRALRRAA